MIEPKTDSTPSNPSSDFDIWIEILQNALWNGTAPDQWPAGGSAAPAWEALTGELVEIRRFILRMTEGDLSAELKLKGQVAGSLKALQANLRHLTWQVQQ